MNTGTGKHFSYNLNSHTKRGFRNTALNIGFKSCRETIAGALQECFNRWSKRKHVESNALNSWKLNIVYVLLYVTLCSF